jgi:DNA-binding NtrC family response regulator
MQARHGLLELAVKHLEAAENLLEREPQYEIAGTLWLDRSAVELYMGDYAEALAAALNASRAADFSGHLRHKLAAYTNEAFLRQQIGQLNEAEDVLAKIPEAVAEFTSLHLAVLDNKSELRVLQGRLDEADELLRRAMQLAADSPGLRHSWQHLAAMESRVRLLHLRGDSQQAGELALAAEHDAERRSDHLLRLSYRLLRASILLDSGSADSAAVVLRDLVRQRDQLSRSQDLELDRLLADYYARRGDTRSAHDHLLRAARMQESYSNAITRVYLQRTATALGVPGLAAGRSGVPSDSSARPSGHEPSLDPISLKSVEELFQLAAIPELLGREVLHVLLRSGCICDARVVSAAQDAAHAASTDAGGSMSISLGTFLGRSFRIEARVHPQLEALETFVIIRRLVETAVRHNQARNQEAARTSLWRFESVSPEGSPLVVSTAMQQVLITIHHLASSDAPVLLTGETGTGKEVFARELHRASGARGPFIPFNCTAVAADMLDAQLFGYRRGAFTGATDNFPGIVRSAAGGTLFLDEIGELDFDLQPKLLRLLDRSEVHPLGDAHPTAVRVRLVAATNANLDALMRAGRFREDLYYRLNVCSVHIPPLRERREEIPPLADHYLERYAREARKARLTLSDDALENLLLHRWPGNVRQLASEMRRLVTFCRPGTVVAPTDLSAEIRAARRSADSAAAPAPANTVHVALDQPLDAAIEAVERALVQYALAAEGGHLQRAAERLAISRKGLFLKRRRLGLDY